MTVPRPLKPPAQSDLLREYVAGGSVNFAAYSSFKRAALPWNVDDLTGQLGMDIYEKMMLDGQVSACMTVFKASVVETGLSIGSAVNDEADDGYDTAKEIADSLTK